ncbi:MAG TPA: plastocyanin/azurin family copper-binding protein [Rhizomicrobium sp.]|jgi:plastocyanin|nr:plastocyanin/azurin family copper-binding protein [Rhizomicrobium sp.]
MSISRRVFTELLAALGVTAVTPALAQGATVDVSMKQSPKMVFVPATVNIKAGDTVKWTNPYNITHTVTFDPAQAQTASDVSLPAGVAPFGSGDIEEEGTFSHTFTAKGTYKYVCKYHEAMGMTGTVVVS